MEINIKELIQQFDAKKYRAPKDKIQQSYNDAIDHCAEILENYNPTLGQYLPGHLRRNCVLHLIQRGVISKPDCISSDYYSECEEIGNDLRKDDINTVVKDFPIRGIGAKGEALIKKVLFINH